MPLVSRPSPAFLGLTLIAAAFAQAQECTPGWDPAMVEGAFGYAGVRDGGFVSAVEFDDGRGTALYLAGGFSVAGTTDAKNIVRWDGQAWEPLGEGLDGAVAALAVYDDGTGPSLYAGGSFEFAGGQFVRSIARWDGSLWHAVGSGVAGNVRAMVVFDPGDGPRLYVGGSFASAGADDELVVVDHLAQWDGVAWSPVADATFGGFGVGGAAVSSFVNTLAVFDDGAGPSLFVGGRFVQAGGRSANRVARWDGQNWFDLGVGLSGATPGTTFASSMVVHDDGSGPALYVGGRFADAGGVRVNNIARWDGAQWTALGSGTLASSAGFSPDVLALASFQGPSGPELFVGGFFARAGGAMTRYLARWDGRWSPLPRRFDSDQVGVYGFLPIEVDGAPRLVICGAFNRIERSQLGGVMVWDGAAFGTLDGRFYPRTVQTLTTVQIGSARSVYAFASTSSDSADPRILVQWDGRAWIPLRAEIVGTVASMVWFDDGGGPGLFVAGNISSFGGQDLGFIGKWDGVRWRALGDGLGNQVRSLAVFNDGGGPALYAGGLFVSSGTVGVNRIARWDGTAWSPLGDGLDRSADALAVADLGDGPALYAGGSFSTAGGAPASMVARWDGAAWTPLGAGIDGVGVVVLEPATLPGAGPTLFAAGNFSTAGGVPARRVASWDGSAWNPLGGGTGGFTFALATYDDGRGEAIYLGGDFVSVGGVSARNIARWDGVRWEPLGQGANGAVNRLAVVDTASVGAPDGLYAQGAFGEVGGRAVPGVARWRCEPPACRADLDGDGELTFFDFLLFQNLFAAGDLRADFDGDGQLTFFDFLAFQDAFAAGCP